MVDDDSLPWGTMQCAGKLARFRLLDWSFYALILVFLVTWCFLFGSLFKSQLGSLVSGVKQLLRGLVPIGRKKKRCSHCKRRTRAKAKDRVWRWRRQALPVALVVHCWRRSSILGSQNTWSMNILYRRFKNKAPCLAFNISEPVNWKWKKKKVGLSSVMSELKLSTLQGFCAVDHDFLRLPQLLKTFLQSWLPYEADQVRAVLSCSTSWYFWDASVSSRPSLS